MTRKRPLALSALLLSTLALRGIGQEPSQPPQEPALEFNFKDAPLDHVLEYISKKTGYQFINEAKVTGTVTAVSATPVPREKVFDFLTQILLPKDATIEVRAENVVRIIKLDVAKKRNLRIQIGNDPDKLQDDDRIVTQIIPLEHLSVEAFSKGDLSRLLNLDKVDTFKDNINNLIIMMGPSSEIKRFLVLLRILDMSQYGLLKWEIIELKNASAADTAKVVNEIFGKVTGESNQGPSFPFPFPFGGGGGRGNLEKDATGAGPKLTSFIKVIPDSRTNSLICAATEANVKLIKELVSTLDSKSVGVSQLQVFHLKNANAREVADQIMTLFKPPENMEQSFLRLQRRIWLPWLGDPQSSSPQENVRAIADTRTNSVIVATTEGQMKVIQEIISKLDMGLANLLRVEFIPIRNGDAAQIAGVIEEMFQKDTPSQGQGGGRSPPWLPFPFLRGESSTPAPPGVSELVKVVPDARTNSILAAATEENMATIKRMIAYLDTDEIEAVKLVTYPLKYADAREVASLISNLFAESSSGSTSPAPLPRGANAQQRRAFEQLMRQQQSSASGARPIQVKTIADTRTNSVMVAATESQLRIIHALIAEIDREVTSHLPLRVYTLKNGDAKEMAAVIKGVFAVAGSRLAQNVARTQAIEVTTDERTNSIIVKATEENLALIDSLVSELDSKPTEDEKIQVISLRNADAVTVMQTITSLLKGGGQVPKQRGQSSSQPQGQGRTGQGRGGPSGNGSGFEGPTPQLPGINRLGPVPGEQEPPASETQEPEVPGGLQGKVEIQADPDTNKLVIRTNPRNFATIKKLVDELDRFQPQVLVRVLIAEATLSDGMEFGVEGFFKGTGPGYKGVPTSHTVKSDFSMGAGGFSYLLQTDEYEATLRALAKEGKLKVHATPRILVLDNQEASLTVGKLVPFVQSSRTDQFGNIVNTIQYQDIGILLRVKPRINPDGIVTMEIHPEISEVASESEAVLISSNVKAQTFNRNAADTTVVIRHGQTIILGGLIREFKDESEEKVPILGDIPLLGLFFSSTVKKRERRELMIFITPHVVFSQQELEEMTELEKAKLRILDPNEIEKKGREWREFIRD